MSDLVWKSMVELARLIASKAASPVEVVQAHLDRIAALDGKLKSYITVLGDSALQAAKAAEAQVMSGNGVGPLHGVPVGLKDLYCTKGVKTTGGSKILGDWVPSEDATVVSRLTAAGAIVLGKLNMHEFAYGPEGLNPHYGTPCNPCILGDGLVEFPGQPCGGDEVCCNGLSCASGVCTGTIQCSAPNCVSMFDACSGSASSVPACNVPVNGVSLCSACQAACQNKAAYPSTACKQCGFM